MDHGIWRNIHLFNKDMSFEDPCRLNELIGIELDIH